MEKKQYFSIRKIGSFVGSFLIASSYFSTMTYADTVTFKYVDRHELSQQQQNNIQSDDEIAISADTYYLVYEPEATLPHTGSHFTPLIPITGVATLAIGTLLVARSKKKKTTLTLFVLTAAGLLPVTQAVAIEQGLLSQYNQVIEATHIHDGVMDIPGYRYIGFLIENSDNNADTLLPQSPVTEENTLSEKGVPATQDELPEFPSDQVPAVTEKGDPATQDELPEFPSDQVPAVSEKGQPATQDELPEFPSDQVPAVTEKGDPATQDELPEFPSAQVPAVSEKGQPATQDELPEFPSDQVPAVAEKGDPAAQDELPEFPSDQVPAVSEKGQPATQDELPEFPSDQVPAVTEKGDPAAQDELPEFPSDQVPAVSEKGQPATQDELPEFPIVQVPPVAEKGEPATQDELPEFPSDQVPAVTEKGEPATQDELPEFPIDQVPAVSEKGDPATQDELPEFPIDQVPAVTEKGDPATQDGLPEFPSDQVPAVTEKGDPATQDGLPEFPSDQVPAVTEKGEPATQDELPEFPINQVPAVSEKGQPATQDELPEFPIDQVPAVSEKGQPATQDELPEFPIDQVPAVTEKGQPATQDELPEFPIDQVPAVSEKGEPATQDGLPEFPIDQVPAVTEKGEPATQDELPEFPINQVPAVSEKGQPAIENVPSLVIDKDETVDIPHTTIEEKDDSKYIGDNTTIPGTIGQKRVVTFHEEVDGKTTTEPTTQEIILTEMVPTRIIKGTKELPKFIDLTNNKTPDAIYKFLPYYNKEYVDAEAKKLRDSGKVTKEILSVTPMTNHAFTPTGDNLTNIFVLYKDGTKDIFTLSKKTTFNDRVDEYTIDELGITYTPRYKAETSDITKATEALDSVQLYSNAVYAATTRNDPKNQKQYIQELYFDEANDRVKQEWNTLVPTLLEHGSTADKIVANKDKIYLGLVYLDNYYQVQFGHYNLKNLLLTDFYGTKQDIIDTLITLGGDYNKLRGRETSSVFNQLFAKHTQSKTLSDFFTYNRKLFTNYTTDEEWFKATTKDHVVLEERASLIPELATTSYKVYDKLQYPEFSNYLLPMLNLKKSTIYVLSNYSTLVFGSRDRRSETPEVQWRQALSDSADAFRDFIDTWYRIAEPTVKQRLVQTRNLPIYDGYNQNGKGWVERFGRLGQPNEYSSIREFFGPIGKYYSPNGSGAYAQGTQFVHYIVDDVLTTYGQSVFTHEVTHVYDNSIFLGGYRRRDGMGAEAFAQGLLQVPSGGSTLGVNLMFTDKTGFYNATPNVFQSQEEIDNYMKHSLDSLMLLSHAEADAVLALNNQQVTTTWFKKMDRELKANGKDQYDRVRALTDAEKEEVITSINDLVDNNFMTDRGIRNGRYDGNGIEVDTYVTIPALTSIYGGNTSQGAAGAVMFKSNAFYLWGYYGYSKGFLGYASNKYSAQAKKDGTVLSDAYIINKLSDGKFNTLEEWKKSYYQEVVDKANTYFRPVEINGQTIKNYDELVQLFTTTLKNATANDVTSKTIASGMGTLFSQKEALYKTWLKDTNSFQSNTIGEI